MRSFVVVSILCGAGAAYADDPAPTDQVPTDPANPAPVDPAATTEPAPAPAPPPVVEPIQPTPPPAPAVVDAPDPTMSPGFVTMLRQDGNSRIGGDATYFILDSDDATVLRFDLHGHYVDHASGAGVYAQVPITWYSENDMSETVLGGVEIGGIFIPKITMPGVGVVMRGGVSLPTVSQDETALAGLVATYLRPIDIYDQLPKAATLRLAVSPMIRSGQFFARLDAGVDINVYFADEDKADPALLIDAGVGYDLGSAAIMAELSTVAATGDNGDSVTSAALSVRGNAGKLQPYGALLIPMDSDVGQVFDAGLLFGLEAKL